MCYDIKTSLEAQLKRAKRNLDLKAIEEITEKLIPLTDLPLHHASGFTHPEVLIYTNDSPFYPTVATWGLVPHWVKGSQQQLKIWNNTLNARGETLFIKPSFRDAAKHSRCIIYVDGFFEHHHYKNKVYPFFIQRKNKEPMALAGLWSRWQNPENGGSLFSFTIVTTTGNKLLSKIHNNPKLEGPRMPFILLDEEEETWLQHKVLSQDGSALTSLIQSYPEGELIAHTVGKLRGKEYRGNCASSTDEVIYSQLDELVL